MHICCVAEAMRQNMGKNTNRTTKQAGLLTRGRSRITNSHGLLPSVDGRSTWARRLRDLIAQHVSDMGGEDACSTAELSLVRRAATLTIELERLELRFHMNDGAKRWELEAYQRSANTLRRLLQAIGLQRRMRDVTPTLDEYLAGRGRSVVREAAE